MNSEGKLSNYDFTFDDEEDGSYRPRSRTPPSESFSYDENYHHKRRKGAHLPKVWKMMQ